MGVYHCLYLGNYEYLALKGDIDPKLMTIFRETDKKIGEEEGEDNVSLVTVKYSNCVGVIKKRLGILGFSLENIKSDFEDFKRGEIGYFSDSLEEETLNSSILSDYKKNLSLLRSTEFEDYLEAIKEILTKNFSRYDLPVDPDNPHFPLMVWILKNSELFLGSNIYDPRDNYYVHDIRSAIRFVLEALPDDSTVTLDLTEQIEAGWYSPKEDICKYHLDSLIKSHPVDSKIIILTEGSTDKNILETSFKLLFSDYSDYYSFMDFEEAKPEGGASHLVSTIKSFISAGVSNRIIALFDNDTAAKDAIRSLEKINVPENIKILQYPDLEIAKNYPAIGPSGIHKMNINGLAGSIEIYLGKDVLSDKNGEDLLPIQWKGFNQALKQYQGEILDKRKIQKNFKKKISKFNKGESAEEDGDWDSLRLIFEKIFAAFD